MTTILEAVNTVLVKVGLSPATGLDTANPEIAAITILLDAARKDVLGEGWNLNSEHGYRITADALGNIAIPAEILNLSVNQEDTRFRHRAIQRDGKLYDKLNHTFNWTPNTAISCDVLWDFNFEDLPSVFQQYIIQRAARTFAGSGIGSEAMVKFNALDEASLRANCLAYDCSTGRHNAIYQGDRGEYWAIPPRTALSILNR